MRPMFTFIETKLFTRLADEQLPDDELSRLQHYLNENPEAGDIIRESGGVRKLRWGAPGRGKRGGFRIIYYLRSKQGEIWLLTLYAKNVAESISGQILRKIKEEIDG
jgi:mRNA-degrading endonuclease RelE of RelBE toxin-antitoxin system